MSRKRMYLFERAYTDYISSISKFSRWFTTACERLWEWFWIGRGSHLLIICFYIALVMSIIGGVLIYSFQQAGNNIRIPVQLMWICYFVIFLAPFLWQQMHLVLRLSLGVCVTNLMIMIACIFITYAIMLSIISLLILFTLTIFSFLLFLPIRTYQELWLLYRHITYQCPYDDCSYTGLPTHICSCGTQYKDLLPNFYGIFYHTCNNEDHKVRLPTLNILGRNKLNRRCGQCERPLVFSTLGELGIETLVVVGGPSAGKTVFLAQVIPRLIEYLKNQPCSEVYIDSLDQQQKISALKNKLTIGQLVDKTVGDVMEATAIAIKLRKPQMLRKLLYIYDEPGEDFTQIERFGKKQMVQNLSGVILLVDPFSTATLMPYGRKQKSNLKPSKASLYKIAIVLINGVTQMQIAPVGQKCDIPMAVVLSKADALPTQEFPYLTGLCVEQPDKEMSNKCREALKKLGEERSIRALEQKFSSVRYFACTGLGRMPERDNSEPFVSSGVIAPLLWVSGMNFSF